MATYTYTTTAAEDEGLTYAVTQANAALNKKAVRYTATSYLQARIAEILASYAKVKSHDLEADIAGAFTEASAEDQDAIKTLLGLS